MNPRQQGKVTYPLDEILLLRLLAVLAGVETFVDIALFSCKSLGLRHPAAPAIQVWRPVPFPGRRGTHDCG